MANERDVALLTDRIATAMAQANGTLRTLTDDFGNDVDRMLSRRLEDVDGLKPGITGVRSAEQAIRDARGAAVAPAERNLYSVYRSYQATAGDLASRIGAAERALDEIRDDLGRRAGALKQSLKDLDAIEQLPGRATDDIAKLRSGVEYLSSTVDVVDGRVEQAMRQLAVSRQSASEFERSTPRIDGADHSSSAVRDATTEIEGSISRARADLRALHGELAERGAGFHTVAQFGVDVATTAAADQQRAAAEEVELANAVRAGANPTSPAAQHTVGTQGESDISRRMNGPVQQSGLNL